jgi:Flp pilus assembly protein TadB
MLRSRLLLAAVMTAATALFVVGVSVERAQPDQHAGERAEQSHETGESHAETGEEAVETHGAPSVGESGHDTHQEEPRILGIDPESTPLVVVAIVGSLLLVAAVLRWSHATALLAFVAVAMLAFAALDVREVTHQLDEDQAGVAILAASVATLHLAAAALAGMQASRHAGRPPAPAT